MVQPLCAIFIHLLLRKSQGGKVQCRAYSHQCFNNCVWYQVGLDLSGGSLCTSYKCCSKNRENDEIVLVCIGEPGGPPEEGTEICMLKG